MLSLINICCSTHDKPANPSILDFHFQSGGPFENMGNTFHFLFSPPRLDTSIFSPQDCGFWKIKKKIQLT